MRSALDLLGISQIGEIMEIILTIEAQNAVGIGLAHVLDEVNCELSALTNNALDDEGKYGTEFKSIAIIPSCMDDSFWQAMGWKERKLIRRKKGEADIRLRMDYPRFISETMENKRLMFIATIVKSIQAVQDKSKGDYKGEELIQDILSATNVTMEKLAAYL